MLFNWRSRQIHFKVVYYGAALSGKTTNIKYIFQRVDPKRRSELVSLQTHEDRTLYFDFLQLEMGKICGFTPVMQLYTVPGQSYYQTSRRLVLRYADAVVFVVDSHPAKLSENRLAWQELFEFMADLNLMCEDVAIAIQYNKRDLPDALPIAVLQKEMARAEMYPAFEAIASEGKGVYDTFKSVVGQVAAKIQRSLQN